MIIVRALQTAASITIGIATAAAIGQGDTAKLVAVPVTAAVMIAIEYGLTIAPRRWRRARRRLDPRGVFEGVWLQHVKRVVTTKPESQANQFAVFTVKYAGDSEFCVEGTAYDPAGAEHARWHSEEKVHFARNGAGMTYIWSGDLLVGGATGSTERTGFCRVWLSSDDGGTGRVDHVSEQVTLLFNVQRVTPEMLAAWAAHGGTDRPESLADPNVRDRFAKFHAERLAAAPQPAAPGA